ncbi:MAG: hypothetical protein WCG93_10790 [Paludibacter sp.]
MKTLLLALLIAFSFSSCMVTKTSCGHYREQQGSTYTYAKGKQLWIFFGIIPLGRTGVATPASGDCEVRTQYKFGDFLISAFTGGIITSMSIKVTAKENPRITN